MKIKRLLLFILVVILAAGCATKRYGRMQNITGYESKSYDCNEIKIELSKLDAFELQVEEGSKFSFLSIASFLGDFGIGNVIEKNAALKTAKERRVQLNDLAASKNCP